MAKPRYLLDASALYPLLLKLRERIIEYFDLLAILDLTVYEVGNAIWKEYRVGRIRDPVLVARAFSEVMKRLHILSIHSSIDEVVELAARENLTFYDASYLYVATSRNMKLVTEDRDLLKYPQSITVEQLLRELEKG